MKRYIFFVVLLIITLSFYGYRRGMSPSVSVVMLTYQRADILHRSIKSILNQTYTDFEFIILNDGSTDNTKEVVSDYKDKRIRYYENEKNRGIVYSRNRAASLAKGKYIMIMDDDDIALPHRMVQQKMFLDQHPEIDVVAGQIKDYPRIPTLHDKIATGLIQYNNFGNSNVMYRRDSAVKNHIRYQQIGFGEDWAFWVQMLLKGAKFAALPDDVLIRHGQSQKHYDADINDLRDMDRKISNLIGNFFSPENPEYFGTASPCEKLRLIADAPLQIFSKQYLTDLLRVNECPL
jgi:glycosyltransferase involved in cell wall biosynthesis